MQNILYFFKYFLHGIKFIDILMLGGNYMEEYNKEVGKRIHLARTNKGMTLKDLGNLIDVAESTAQRYEKGKIKSLDIKMIKKIATALGVSPSYLMGWEEDNVYYLNNDAREYAQELFDNRELKLVMDASRKLSKKSLTDLKNIIDSMKGEEEY